MTQATKKEAPTKGTSAKKVAENSATVNKVRTIKLNGNIEYAKVSARISEFHKLHPNGSIRNAREFKDGWAIFDSTVVLDVKNLDRTFNGSSMGKVGAQKAFEKLETIAVGRALAFAGFLSDGEIASLEEMAKYEESVIQVNVEDAVTKLQKSKSLDDLKSIWMALTPAERNNEEIAFTKEEIKVTFQQEVVHENA